MKCTTHGVTPEDIKIQYSIELLSGGCILNIEDGQLVLVVGSTFSRAFSAEVRW